MKIFEPNTLRMTPQAKMWSGVILAPLSLLFGILDLADLRTVSDKIYACFWFANFLLMASDAWLGYRRRWKDSAQ
jgi:hypothetical protein